MSKTPSGKIVRDKWVRHLPGRRRTPKLERSFRVPLEIDAPKTKQEALESLPTYWVPGRASDPVTVGRNTVNEFRAKLREIEPTLDVAWNPVAGQWGLWCKKPSIKTEWCRGWKLLFELNPDQLDDRVLVALYQSDAERFGGAKQMYERYLAERQREQQRADARHSQEARDWANAYFDHTRPQVGYGHSNGSKFAEHG